MNHAEVAPELITAIHDVVSQVMRAARVHGPLPSMYSPEFVTAPAEVRLAVLAIGGAAWVFARETVECWLDDDYAGGKYHRSHIFPALTELDRLRWPPTGDRDLWVRYGPDGPPSSLEIAA